MYKGYGVGSKKMLKACKRLEVAVRNINKNFNDSCLGMSNILTALAEHIENINKRRKRL